MEIAMSAKEITVNVTAFKAQCLDLFKQLEQGKLKRIIVTRRGSSVAEVAPRRRAGRMGFEDVYGCMRGLMNISPDYDPFEQVIEEPKDPFLDRKRRRGSAA
jgi:hypothetical protein